MDSHVSMETGGGPTVTNLSVLGRKREQGGFSQVVPLPTSPSCSQLCPGSSFVSLGEAASLSSYQGYPKPSLNRESLTGRCPAPPAACLPHPRAREGTGTPQSNLWPFLAHALLAAPGVGVGSRAVLGHPWCRPVPSQRRRLCLLLRQAAGTRVPHSA